MTAFNHLQPDLLSGDPRGEGGKRVLFYSGGDARAKAQVGALIEQVGFFGIDLGPLALGGQLVRFPGGPLPALNLVRFASVAFAGRDSQKLSLFRRARYRELDQSDWCRVLCENLNFR